VEVEAVGVFGATDATRAYERRERNHIAVVVAHVILIDVLFAAALLPFRLQEDPPLAAEAVELVQVETAQISLQRLVDVRNSHALFKRFVAVEVGVDLREGGGEL